MTIAVLGLGGVGGYLGAKLCTLKNEHTIVFLTRGKHLTAIQDNGLTLIEPDQSQNYIPSIATDQYDQHIDLLFLCTKSYSHEAALSAYLPCLNETSHIVVIANGTQNKAHVQKLTSAKVTASAVYIIAHNTMTV